MPLQGEEGRKLRILADLDRIQDCIDRGARGEARELLCALPLIATPLDDCAAEIGQLFLIFDYPLMAARFWYYVDNRTEAMERVIRQFEHSCGGNPEVITQSVGGFWNPAFPPREQITKLEREASRLREKFDYEYDPAAPRWRENLACLYNAFVLLVILFVFVMGFVYIVKLTRNAV